jgi:hypothetical protein
MSTYRHTWPGGHPMWCPACLKRVVLIGQKTCLRCSAAEAELLQEVEDFINHLDESPN